MKITFKNTICDFSFKRYFKSVLLIYLIPFSEANAQSMTTIQGDSYLGINNLITSPTFALDAPLDTDINILTINIEAYNNYAYISKTSILDLAQNNFQITQANLENNIRGHNTPRTLDAFENKNDKKALFYLDILGPSFYFKNKMKNKVYGFFTRLRAGVTAKDIHFGYNYHNFETQEDEDTEFTIGKFDVRALTWTETGLHYSTVLEDYLHFKKTMGINLKYIKGVDGVFVKQKAKEVDVINNPDSLQFTSPDLEVGISRNLYHTAISDYKFKFSGGGIGIDFGYSLVRKEKVKGIPQDNKYKRKITFSLTDLGFVTFKNAAVHTFNNLNESNTSLILPASISRLRTHVEDFSNQLYGDPEHSLSDDAFLIGLPTALHAIYDQKVSKNLFLSFSISQRIPVFSNSILSPNLMSFTVRHESKSLGISLPLRIYEYNDFQWGGYLRIGPLFLGTNNWLPYLLNQNRLKSISYFMGFKAPLFRSKNKKNKPCYCD